MTRNLYVGLAILFSCSTAIAQPGGSIEDNVNQSGPDCLPSPDGFSCLPDLCSPIPEARCTPVCATLNLSSGAISVTECDCLMPNQCHVDINVATFPRCFGDCPPGTICEETRTFLPNNIVEICCRCRPCTCPGDMNGDGILNGLDVQGFINCLLSQPSPTNSCACANVNSDGAVTVEDIPVFVASLLHKVPCPPRGACCLDIDDGPLAFDTCFVTGPQNCQQLGGVYQGDDTTCNIQACCLTNGNCQDADVQCCIASGGIPLGQGTSCASGTACPPIGACCFDATGDGIPESCAVVTLPECQGLQGSFQGAGTQCQGTGACCFGIAGGGCVVIDQICCDDILGAFKGLGTICLGDGNGNGLDDVCELPGSGGTPAP